MSARAGTLLFLRDYIDQLCESYRANARYLAVIRILFALYVIAFPIDYSWAGEVPAVLFHPQSGPFSVLSSPPSASLLVGLEVIRFILASALLVGYRTMFVSIAMTVVLVTGSGIVHSFGKVDHFILFELLPVAMAAAGWGAALSLDARRSRAQRKAPRTRGLPMLIWAVTIAYALFTAALPKAASGWLNPELQATRGYVARDVADPTKLGPLTYELFDIHAMWLWKALDYATVFTEGWLIVAVLFPVLFRIGIVVLLGFHLGVYLALGIEFDSYIFVYLPFLSAPAVWIVKRALGRKPDIGRTSAPDTRRQVSPASSDAP